MMVNKVELCGVNTSKLPLLKEDEKEKLFERIQAGDEEAGAAQRQGNPEKAAVNPAAIDGRGLEELAWHGAEEAGKQENGHRQREGDVGQHQAEPGVCKAEIRETDKQRDQDAVHRNHHTN